MTTCYGPVNKNWQHVVSRVQFLCHFDYCYIIVRRISNHTLVVEFLCGVTIFNEISCFDIESLLRSNNGGNQKPNYYFLLQKLNYT